MDFPDADNEVVGRFAAEERTKGVARLQGLNGDGIGEDHGGAFLFDRDNLVKADDEGRDPAQDVATEANMSFGNVNATSEDDFALERAAVVFDEIVVLGHASEELVKVAVALFASDGKACQPWDAAVERTAECRMAGPDGSADCTHRLLRGTRVVAAALGVAHSTSDTAATPIPRRSFFFVDASIRRRLFPGYTRLVKGRRLGVQGIFCGRRCDDVRHLLVIRGRDGFGCCIILLAR